MGDAEKSGEVVAFQGSPGAYSHAACRGLCPDATPQPFEFFDEALLAVEAQEASWALVPVENNLGGRVAEIHQLLRETPLQILKEHFHPIDHCLMGPAGSTLDSLRFIHSHYQGLAQCRQKLRRYGMTAIAESDTARAAQLVAEKQDTKCGAIASALAADIHGLTVVQHGFQDRPGNTTRFVLLGRPVPYPAWEPEHAFLTAVVFQTRSVPAALYKGLGGFATNKVNLVKLESYMIDERFTNTQFFVEFEGHLHAPEVQLAMEELSFFSVHQRVLGVYPASSWRTRAGPKPAVANSQHKESLVSCAR